MIIIAIGDYNDTILLERRALLDSLLSILKSSRVKADSKHVGEIDSCSSTFLILSRTLRSRSPALMGHQNDSKVSHFLPFTRRRFQSNGKDLVTGKRYRFSSRKTKWNHYKRRVHNIFDLFNKT